MLDNGKGGIVGVVTHTYKEECSPEYYNSERLCGLICFLKMSLLSFHGNDSAYGKLGNKSEALN